MIFVVDNDADSLAEIKAVLEEEGYEVATFDGAESALDLLSSLEEPELIISEVDMPGIDGFEFKRAHSRRFLNSLTPFVFLTKRSDESSIGKGLALGVDDYIIKPLTPNLLKMKIRSLIARKNHYLIHTFYGDLARMPFFKLMQFCESKGLTGEVEVISGETDIIMAFRAGQIQSDVTSDDVLLKIYDLSEGTFIIRAMPMDFSELAEYAAKPKEEPETPGKVVFTEQETEPTVYTTMDKPMGKLSGIQADKRLFQFQTEFVTEPSYQIQTIVVLEGRVMSKQITPVQGKLSKAELTEMIEKQHNKVEGEIRSKLTSIAGQKKAGAQQESPELKFKRLFEEGFEKYRSSQFEEALQAWEAAYAINPTDKTLETNIRILKKKLGEAS